MKKHNRKQTPDDGAGFDEAGHVEQTTGFDYASIYASDEGIDADAVSHGQTRDEYEAQLRERGLTAEQAAILYDRDVRKLSLRQIASEQHTARGTVAYELRRARARLRHGKPTAATLTKPGALPRLLATMRDILDSERQAAWNYEGAEKTEAGTLHVFSLRSRTRYASVSCPDSLLTQQIVDCVRQYPATLTNGKGLDWPAKLVEIIGATKWGNPTERKAAREALAILTKCKTGNPVEYAKHPATASFALLCMKLATFQREYQATAGTATIAERLAALRAKHPGELDGFPDAELQRILNRKPLAVAVELAASATGVSADYWRDLARRERAEIEAALAPPRRPS